jgi:hypothetical protein
MGVDFFPRLDSQGAPMTDALSEALMKLSAAKPVAGSSAGSAGGVPEAVAVALPAPAEESAVVPANLVESAEFMATRFSPAENAERSPVAAAVTGLRLSGLGGAPVSPPAATNRAAAPPSASAAAQRWIVKIRELRGWVAAGIGLAILFTIVDDLWRKDLSSRTAGAAANAGADVDLDELLREFETVEPAARRERKESRPSEPLMDAESSVTADYGSSESDIESASATTDTGSSLVRFTGRIEPLK